jgi:hypothetical protein
MACQDTNTIIANGGQVLENLDGTVSVYILNSANILFPSILTQQCCLALNPSYTFDINTQSCLWKTQTECSLEDVFKITLNPQGNEGSIFYVDDDESCNLKIEFDYLFKIKCETLSNLLNDGVNGLEDINPDLYNQIVGLQLLIEEQTVECESLTNQINLLTEQINNTAYSIICNQTQSPVDFVVGKEQLVKSFSKTGFGDLSTVAGSDLKTTQRETLNVHFCLTEPEGLVAWSQILGSNNYATFINGGLNSYTCEDVQAIMALNETNLTSTPQGPLLIYDCDTPYGSKSDLISQQNTLIQQQLDCQNFLAVLISRLNDLQAQGNTILASSCVNPIDMFESLDMSVTLDIVGSDNMLQSVYEDTQFFQPIGNGQLYQYLTTNANSGFYVCGDPDCQPLNLNLSGIPQENSSSCNGILQNIIDTLFVQSNLQDVENGLTTFNSSLSNTAFASQWLNYSTTITDPEILTLIYNQQIKFSIKVNHTCGDICILIDNIKLSKECTSVSERKLFVTKSPGFVLEKIIDNKKSWLNNDTFVSREFDIKNLSKTDVIRQTKYDVDNEKLVINTKEIDLDVSLASAIETDVWCFLIDNPCLFTGETNCIICGDDYKQFQDGVYINFMDGFPYEFMDDNFGGVNKCCGDDLIQFDELMTKPLSEITVLEDFQYYLTSELIDAKNRQTISSYATLKALYDRYLNSYNYCGIYSAGFTYYTMEQFADLLGDYWVDIIEQVVPSTTIWGSVRVYSNSLFDQQKFKYKAYTSLLCRNPFFGETVLSPINGTSGTTEAVEVSTVTLSFPTTGQTGIIVSNPNVCNQLHIAQMNSGSEFIGTVSIIASTACQDGIAINECLMQVNVDIDGYTATANVENAALPITYEWNNGGTEQSSTYDGPGQYKLIVTDANCCSVTIPFEIPVIQTACWYTNPDSQDFIDSSFQNFSTPFYNYTMQSLIVNGVEFIIGAPPVYTLTSSNFETVSTPAGLTYTNFVTFLNQAFTSLGLANYSAQLALNGDQHGSQNQGFYIIRPLGDTFSMQISETNSPDYYITDDDMLNVGYFLVDCDNITVVDGVVVE